MTQYIFIFLAVLSVSLSSRHSEEAKRLKNPVKTLQFSIVFSKSAYIKSETNFLSVSTYSVTDLFFE